MDEIVNKDRCVGCGACRNACPKGCIGMDADQEGFLHPTINTDLCIDCRLCQSVCPVLSDRIADHLQTRAYGAHAKEQEVVHNSSSGGIFTLLSKEILNRGGVVFGASFDGPEQIQHIAVEDEVELWRLRGSKYVQSHIGITYQQAAKALKSDRWVLFSGMPCQIAGLRSYLRKDYEKLLCVDTICHSAPSPKVWKQFLNEVQSSFSSKVIKANFREKQNGWEKYFLRLDLENGETIRYTGAENWYMQAFIQGLSTRPSCYSCKFKGENHLSDLTLGDFWGVRQAAPECLHTDGTSLVLAHTEKGQHFLDLCKDQMEIRQTDFSQAIQPNPAYLRPSVPHRYRQVFFHNLGVKPIIEMVPQYLKPTVKEQIQGRLCGCMIARILGRIKRSL